MIYTTKVSKDYYNNYNPTELATQNTDSGSYLETYTLPKLNRWVAENLTRPVTNNEIEFHISTGLILTLFNFLSILLHVLCKAHVTLISKLDKDTTKMKAMELYPSEHGHRCTQKIWENQIQQHTIAWFTMFS